MKLQSLLPVFIAALAATGCPDAPGNEELGPIQVALEQPADADEHILGVGEEVSIPSEQRDGMLLILEGIPSPASDEPLKYGLVRVVDAPMYVDTDDTDGPRQWITVAEIQDDDGNVLWFDRVNTLFQLLEYLDLVLSQQAGISFSVGQVFSFVFMQYPQLLQFGVRVPLSVEGGTQYVLKVPKENGDLYEVYRASLADLQAAAEPASLSGEVATIVESAPSEDAVDIVILGDGYTADQKEEFLLDAQAIADRFVQTQPFASRQKAFNIRTVWTPSVEAGAGYDCTGILTLDVGCKDELRDTPFETVFVISALADRLGLDIADTQARVAMPLQIGRLFEAAASTPFDEILMISNTKRTSGFAGLYVSIVTAYDPRIDFPDTAVHELGHSFGVLGDEYEVEGDPCLYDEPRIKLPENIARELTDIKWGHHIPEGTELPTPSSSADDVPVGAYSGAYNCDFLYRPSHTCKMRDSDTEFCPVCSEQLVRRIYAYTDPIAQGEDQASVATVVDEATLEATVPLREPDAHTVVWTLGDEEVGTGPSVQLDRATLPTEWTALTATVRETSAVVKTDFGRLVDTRTWWVRR